MKSGDSKFIKADENRKMNLAVNAIIAEERAITFEEVRRVSGIPLSRLRNITYLKNIINCKRNQEKLDELKGIPSLRSKVYIAHDTQSYADYIRSFYFKRPQTISEVTLKLYKHVSDFNLKIVNQAIKHLITTKVLKPGNKPDTYLVKEAI